MLADSVRGLTQPGSDHVVEDLHQHEDLSFGADRVPGRMIATGARQFPTSVCGNQPRHAPVHFASEGLVLAEPVSVTPRLPQTRDSRQPTTPMHTPARHMPVLIHSPSPLGLCRGDSALTTQPNVNVSAPSGSNSPTAQHI